jgi:hypothetical protein
MTLHRSALAELARECIACRHVGYRVALEKLHELQRSITPEMILKLVADAERDRGAP